MTSHTPATSDADERIAARGARRLRHEPLLFVGTVLGYILATVVAAAASWALPRWLGYRLEWTLRETGPLAWDGVLVGTAFRVAWTSFPLVFAGVVVAIDLLLVRALTDGSDPNVPDLLGWFVAATAGLGLVLAPSAAVLSPYGVVRLLSAPVLGLAVIALAGVAAVVGGTLGSSVPHRLTAGETLRGAGERVVESLVADPVPIAGSVRPLLAGSIGGTALLVAGTALLGLSLGLWVVGLLFLPGVLLLWIGAALAFAAGHLAFRLRTSALAARS